MKPRMDVAMTSFFAFAQAERKGSAERCHVQRTVSVRCARIAPSAFAKQRRQSRFGEHVQPVVAGSTIGTQRDVHACVQTFRHRRNAACQLEVRAGTVQHVHAFACEHFQIGGCDLGHVHGLEAW